MSMPIVNALITTTFLVLLAASAAVTGSMIVLGIFDRIFNRKKAAVAEEAETDDALPDPLSYDI
jgi:hypothetical protein